MTILTANDLRVRYGIREILQGASLAIETRERLGLVGRNGSGKTTLVRILADELSPDAGEVVTRAGLAVGYLAQEPRFPPGLTAVQAVLAGLTQWQAALDRHADLTARLERGQEPLPPLLQWQAEAAAEVERLGGWDKRHEAATVLGHVGVSRIDAPVDPMSGGERRRVALARVLVAAPDLAILDEPTNHLDIGAIEWLERWLVERFEGALVLVTHDRYLLDRVVTRTLEVEDGRVYSYDGGWGMYLEAKAERDAHAERVESNRRNFLRRELEWLRRTPQARTTKQKARIQRAEAAITTPTRTADKDARIELQHVRSGSTILEAEGITVEIAGRTLVDGLTLRLSKGERIGIVGPNGCGKTSLLRVLTGQAEPAAGTVTHGKNTRIAYLDQQRGGLRDEATVFDNVAEGHGHIELAGQTLEVRAYLERFLFSSHEQRKRVGELSGGERARVALARTLREGANVVVLDEPTNDLDVTTLAVLEQSLLDYPGTLLVVTHDRWFLDRIATSVLVFDDGSGDDGSGDDGPGCRVELHAGGYSDYVERRRSKADHTPAGAPAGAPATKPRSESDAARAPAKRGLTWAEQRELEGLLDRVDDAERAVAALEAELSEPAFYERSDAERRAFFERLQAAKTEAEAVTERWAELEDRREG
ncbi:ABC-F family ATP-binding cassette domain-containing protein [Paraliomyxa miuraensis]|uniref:ABC-F family ATP-binding cassette domain-containing protein n=1 Tax=Paraliomyxa miuraensis TaxID=376150 RepID=UPI00225C120F|nr:ABC-F family ATP-binding cassette domain-containing protein [Paraliomyxa miuraensis]MCX4243870.1 ABC-F family ATP-binding cassette domain-containing protein [Paraliomyxa miuraensis]